MLRVRNLDVAYGKLQALRRVTLHVGRGEIVALIGANGAGKTTLLRTITGLVRAQAGEIHFQGQEIRQLRTEQTVARGCSLVPEGRQVFAAMSVAENLLLGASVPLRRGQRRQVEEDLERVYRMFPVLRDRQRQLAGTLSGGEQQMLALGRALMARPALLMLDEPSMGLAPLVRDDVIRVIRSLNRERGMTILVVEQQARRDADKRAADAQAELAKVAVVKEEPRGLVIMLSGSVLFASGKSELLPAAQNRLNQVAEALLATKERKLTVEGHADAQGSSSYNQVLSQQRADAVRSYLISRGYQSDLIQARGIGEDRPVADNASAEGRANNRRVEIIVEHTAK